MPRTPRARATADAPIEGEAPAPVATENEAAEAAPQASATPAPARRAGRGRRAPTRPAAAEDETAVEQGSDASDDAATPRPSGRRRASAGPRAGRGAATPADAQPDETAAPPPPASQADPPPAAEPQTESQVRQGGGWRPRRPYTVDASGRVIYLDEQGAAATPPAAATGGVSAAGSAPVAEATPEPERASPTATETAPEQLTAAPAEAQEEEARTRAPEPRTAPPTDAAAGTPGHLPGPRARRPRPFLRLDAEAPPAPLPEPEVTVEATAAAELGVIEEAGPDPAPGEPLEDAAASPSDGTAAGDDGSRRRRRSRRGGRGRRRNGALPDSPLLEDVAVDEAIEVAVAEELAPPPAEAPPPARALRERPPERATVGSLEALVARQNVILEQLMHRQERLGQTLESAMKTLEAKLRGTDLSRVSAMPRLAVFVDVPNIVFAADRYRVAVDFGRLLDYVSRDRTLIRASAYAPISDDPTQRLEDQRFVEPFVRHGYRIVTKPLKRFADGSIKANFDVELAMDILTMSDRLDIVSLVSGDGDFRRLVDIVASKGVRVEVVSFSQSTSADLKAVADSYIDLTQHLRDLCTPMEGEIRERRPRPKVDISGYTAGARIE